MSPLHDSLVDADEHLALYGRAKAYAALKQPDLALNDIDRVIRLRPSWRKVRPAFRSERATNFLSSLKGYYCRSQILFDMQRFTAALLSSLQGLTLDPEDQSGKRIMAQVGVAQLEDGVQQKCSLSASSRRSAY